MKLLKFDLDVPFCCSFGEFGTINIQQTYSVVHPPALFGLIQNALGKPAVHTIQDVNAQKKYIKEMLEGYKNLSFAIIVRSRGEIINDYNNILKGQRNQDTETKEAEFSKSIIKKIGTLSFYSTFTEKEKKDFDKKIKPEVDRIKVNDVSALNDIIKIINEKGHVIELKELQDHMNDVLMNIKAFWDSLSDTKYYELNRKWMRTQIVCQKIISPHYTVFLKTKDTTGDYTLEKISTALREPKRPLYLGKSDDLVSILVEGDGIVESNENISDSPEISSITPAIYDGCQIIQIPIKIRNDLPEKESHKNFKMTCSIPYSRLKKDISCVSVKGENIVFLE